jgi:hypothetical protein
MTQLTLHSPIHAVRFFDGKRLFALIAILLPVFWIAFVVVHSWLTQPPPDMEFGKQLRSIGEVAWVYLRPCSEPLWFHTGFLMLPVAAGAFLFFKPESAGRLIVAVFCLSLAIPRILLEMFVFGCAGRLMML